MTHADASLTARFEQAVADSKSLPERPDNFSLLKLYALFKQATEGDVRGERPGAMDFVAMAKWKAREELLGTGTAEAMQKYIDLVAGLKG